MEGLKSVVSVLSPLLVVLSQVRERRRKGTSIARGEKRMENREEEEEGGRKERRQPGQPGKRHLISQPFFWKRRKEEAASMSAPAVHACVPVCQHFLPICLLFWDRGRRENVKRGAERGGRRRALRKKKKAKTRKGEKKGKEENLCFYLQL